MTANLVKSSLSMFWRWLYLYFKRSDFSFDPFKNNFLQNSINFRGQKTFYSTLVQACAIRTESAFVYAYVRLESQIILFASYWGLEFFGEQRESIWRGVVRYRVFILVPLWEFDNCNVTLMQLSNTSIDNPAYTYGGSVKSHTNAYQISRYTLLPHVPLESSFQLTNRMLVNMNSAFQ